MCGSRPCFRSCCGLSLQKSVVVIGIIELVITAIVTILNIVKYAKGVGFFDEEYNDECDDKDVCLGPIIKYAVFDAFFGIICGLMLIFGALKRNHCLLISWMVITICTSGKYLYVVIFNDWSRLEDWISITYLVFYISVFLTVISLMMEVRSNSSSGGVIHSQGNAFKY